MTCIVGILNKGSVYMGGDSLASDTDTFDKYTLRHKKVFHNGPFMVGICGSPRMAQILEHSMRPPTKPKLMGNMKFMATKFIEEVRRTFLNEGYGFMPQGEDNEGGNFLVGFNGGLYEIQEDFQVGEWDREYVAIGSGKNYAYGSLYMTDGVEPRQRINSALEAAAHFNAAVGAPFYVLEQSVALPKKTRK